MLGVLHAGSQSSPRAVGDGLRACLELDLHPWVTKEAGYIRITRVSVGCVNYLLVLNIF